MLGHSAWPGSCGGYLHWRAPREVPWQGPAAEPEATRRRSSRIPERLQWARTQEYITGASCICDTREKGVAAPSQVLRPAGSRHHGGSRDPKQRRTAAHAPGRKARACSAPSPPRGVQVACVCSGSFTSRGGSAAPACAGALGSVPRHGQGQESGNRALATRRMVDSRNQSLGRVTDTQAAVAFVLEGQVLGTGPSQRRARRDRSGHREPRPGWRARWRGSLAGAAVSAPFVLGPVSRCAWRSRWGDEGQGKAHQRLGCSRTPGAEQQRLEKLGAPATW